MKHVIHEQILKGKVFDLKLSEPIIFEDNEKKERSGHLGHAMTEVAPGKIIAFYANSAAIRNAGHSGFGWMEYKTSLDYGETWDEGVVFPYSIDVFLEGLNTVAVEKAVTCANGDVAAFCLINSQLALPCWEPYSEPKVVISKNQGETWESPIEFSSYKGRIYDTLVHNGIVYALEFCCEGSEKFWGTKPEHVYRIFKSVDNCKTFEEVSVVPFESTLGSAYGNMIITPDEKLIVYAYNVNDEQNMDYAISSDFGKTWEKCGKSFVKNCIRNPQVGLLDGQFILHGRAGENSGTHAFIIYTSSDGINWDDGKILVSDKRSCFYSENLTIKGPNGKEKMFVKYSEKYTDNSFKEGSGRVNSMMFTLESIK